MYSREVLDHFENPRNSGELPGASAVVQNSNPVCGDTLQLAVKVEHGLVTAIRFRVKGCVASVACASAITELANGQSLESAEGITVDDIVEKLVSLPKESMHAAYLAVEALTQALEAVPLKL